ncbi:MAG: protein arginine kinase [Desulfitobacterium sp.]
MERKEHLLKHSEWMKERPDMPVVLSSRIRLARNLEGVPFPLGLSQEASQEVEEKVSQQLEELAIDGQKLTYYSIKDLTPIEQYVLIEKHLISPALVSARGARGVAINPDHRVSVMVNEEDHLRIQVLLPGNQLKEAFHLANTLDDELEHRLDLAYRENEGYLTACPTNVGTGMRASVMVHIPALVMTHRVQQLLGALNHLGLAVRGLYGEGSQAFGHIYQVSNQITLGKSEEDTLTHLEAVTRQIIEQEVHARESLAREARITLEDKVWRARGTLENARLLKSEDALQSLSLDRLGVDMGILPPHKRSFSTLLVETLPASLQYIFEKELTPEQRDEQRANFVRMAMSEVKETNKEGGNHHE